MGNIVYNQFMLDLSEKKIDLENDTFKVRLCMTSTECGTDGARGAANLTALEALGDDGIDIFNGSADGGGYDEDSDQTIGNPSAVIESNRMDWSGDNVEWENVSAGDRNIKGALVYWQPGSGTINESTRIPVCYIEFASAIETDGSDVKIKWDSGVSSGDILRMQQASS